MNDRKASADLETQCPNCKVEVLWNDSFPYRPFCSKRCKDSDFIDWANEERKIPGNTQYDDIFSETGSSTGGDINLKGE